MRTPEPRKTVPLEHFGYAVVAVSDVAVERYGHDCDNLRHRDVPFEKWNAFVPSLDAATLSDQPHSGLGHVALIVKAPPPAERRHVAVLVSGRVLGEC